jgi:hypothetical protein
MDLTTIQGCQPLSELLKIGPRVPIVSLTKLSANLASYLPSNLAASSFI